MSVSYNIQYRHTTVKCKYSFTISMSASKQGKQRGDSTNNISYFKQYRKVSNYHGMSQDTWFNYLHIIYIILQVLTLTHKSINKYLYFNLFKIWIDSRQQMSTMLFLNRVVSLHHIFSRQLLFLLLFERCILKGGVLGQRELIFFFKGLMDSLLRFNGKGLFPQRDL